MQRYYPVEAMRAHGGALIDELDGRRTLLYIDPTSNKPVCLHTGATECAWQYDTLELDTGESIRGNALYDAQGTIQAADRPRQSIVCWFGFAFTFPEGQVYEDEP
jgi:hypothetical protein